MSMGPLTTAPSDVHRTMSMSGSAELPRSPMARTGAPGDERRFVRDGRKLEGGLGVKLRHELRERSHARCARSAHTILNQLERDLVADREIVERAPGCVGSMEEHVTVVGAADVTVALTCMDL